MGLLTLLDCFPVSPADRREVEEGMAKARVADIYRALLALFDVAPRCHVAGRHLSIWHQRLGPGKYLASSASRQTRGTF